MQKSKKIVVLYLVNVDWFFISHRLPLALEAIRKGYSVHVGCAISDYESLLKSHGITVHSLNTSRKKNTIFSSISAIRELIALYKRVKPDLVHLITIKPVLLGGIAARICKIPGVIIAISGLGFVYTSQDYFAYLRKKFINFLYYLALSHPNIRVIFQNRDDLETISSISKIQFKQCVLIQGSGVEIDRYEYSKPLTTEPIVLMASRVLRDKGVIEFIQASELLKERNISARFCLAGRLDPDNPASISHSELSSVNRKNIVEYLGHVEEMPNLLNRASIIVLPSYREGMPKILLEASAAGRAVVTTDVPGCRDAVEHNITGLIVPSRDVEALANAIAFLVENPDKLILFGKAGRELAIKNFNLDRIVAEHFHCYESLLEKI